MIYRILLLDDEAFVLTALRRELLSKPYVGHDGLEIESFTSPSAALARARQPDGYFDVVITDMRMPEMNGIAFLKAFNALHPEAVRIVLSGYSDMNEIMRAINEAHIDFFMAKPWREYDLKCTLLQALKHYDVRLENRRLAEEYRQHFGRIHPLPPKERFHLLLVDDDPNILKALERELGAHAADNDSLAKLGLGLHGFDDPRAALAAAQQQTFDLAICDYAMPGLSGLEFFRLLKEIQPGTAPVLLSGAANVDTLVTALNTAGIRYFIAKPWNRAELRAAVFRVLATHELEQDNRLIAELLRKQH